MDLKCTGRIVIELSKELRAKLDWLVSNWERKELDRLSPYNAAFYLALENILNNCATPQEVSRVIDGTLGRIADGYGHMLDVAIGDPPQEVSRVIDGTLGRIADGYGHMLDVDPEELAIDPWAALRRLGDISNGLKKASGLD